MIKAFCSGYIVLSGSIALLYSAPIVAQSAEKDSSEKVFVVDKRARVYKMPEKRDTIGCLDCAPQARVFTFVEQMPEYLGGDKALMDFIAGNLKRPEGRDSIKGKVLLRFIVREDGSVTDVTVVRSLNTAFDNEAVRVVKMLPRFKPALQQGRAARVYFNLPVAFN